jgi:hypothetical protein
MAAQPAAGTDERFATSVAEHFEAFLENFSSELPEGLDTSAADEPSPRDYVDQARGHPRGRRRATADLICPRTPHCTRLPAAPRDSATR